MESDKGIEREVIPFLLQTDKPKTSFLELKYFISESSFKTQLHIFHGGSVEDFVWFLYNLDRKSVV